MKKVIFIVVPIIVVIILIIFLIPKKKNMSEFDKIINNFKISNNVISNKYIENGFNITLSILDVNNPVLIVRNKEDLTEYKLNKIEEDNYSVDVDISNLSNNEYEIYIKDNGVASRLINNLDLLEQLVRSKINDKLVIFDYSKEYMSFKIEDFNYEYDILIDPGHGGKDAGTINNITTEAQLNLAQSLYEKRRYEEHGLKVLLAREDDDDGMLSGSKDWNRAKQRGYSIGDAGVTAKIIYSNHHNSNLDKNRAGFEILVSNTLDSTDLKTELKIINDINGIYPKNISNNTFQIYSRDYETGETFNKIKGQVYTYRDYYATIRIPLELYNVKTVTYEGCYMSNKNNFEWYYTSKGWKTVSEIKIKHYVESLGKTYIPI